jgi:hypothetical protein
MLFGNKGVALISVILLVTCMSVLSMALISMTITEVKIAQNDLSAAQSFFLADGGAQMAVYHLYEEPLFRGELLDLPVYTRPLALGEGVIRSIKVSKKDGDIEIVSLAEVNEAKTKIELTVCLLQEDDPITGEVSVHISCKKWQYGF